MTPKPTTLDEQFNACLDWALHACDHLHPTEFSTATCTLCRAHAALTAIRSGATPVLDAELQPEHDGPANDDQDAGLVYLRDWTADAAVWEVRLWVRDPAVFVRLADRSQRFRVTITAVEDTD
jgi:hypothetical protein